MTTGQIIQTITTFVIAVIATYIAYQQWRTNRLASKLALFDRRFRVFEEVKKILSSVGVEGRARIEEFLRFRTGLPEAYFLFGEEIETYIDEIYLHGRKLALADQLYRMPKEERGDDYDPKKLADEMNVHLTWLQEQLPVAKTKFKQYMDVRKL